MNLGEIVKELRDLYSGEYSDNEMREIVYACTSILNIVNNADGKHGFFDLAGIREKTAEINYQAGMVARFGGTMV